MKIIVTPDDLTSAASTIDNLAADYEKLYTDLFSEVGALQSSWQGKDNAAFTNQIEGFRPDFVEMQKLMAAYATFLRNAATGYSGTQDNITAAAGKLAN